MKKNKNKKGFTLIETLLYVLVASSLVFLMSLFTGTLTEARIKNRTISEVEEQGVHALQMITQSVRNSNGINIPSIGASGATLSLSTSDINTNPTIFDVSNGVLRIKEGTGDPVALTNSHVLVSNLNFINTANPSTYGAIRISFDVNYINPTGKNEYNFLKTFYAGATVRDTN